MRLCIVKKSRVTGIAKYRYVKVVTDSPCRVPHKITPIQKSQCPLAIRFMGPQVPYGLHHTPSPLFPPLKNKTLLLSICIYTQKVSTEPPFSGPHI